VLLRNSAANSYNAANWERAVVFIRSLPTGFTFVVIGQTMLENAYIEKPALCGISVALAALHALIQAAAKI
jgi:hypothetical protein